MPPAARVGDKTDHGGTLALPPSAPRVATVRIGGKVAAVVGSAHVCPIPQHDVGNVVVPSGGDVTNGVLIAGLPAATVGDKTTCEAEITLGDFTVLIGGE